MEKLTKEAIHLLPVHFQRKLPMNKPNLLPISFGKLSQAKSSEVYHNYHSITEGALSNSSL